MATNQTRMKPHSAIIWIVLILLAYAVISFGGLALLSEGRRARYTALVIAHSVLVAGWFGLVAFQAWLAGSGRIAQHRKTGSLSIAYVIIMAAVSSVVMINFFEETGRAGTLAADTLILVNFALFYGLAIAAARRKAIDWHMRFMLASAMAMLGPASGRFVDLIGAARESALFIAIPTLVLPLLVFDYLTKRKIHKASLICIAILLAFLAATLVAFIKLEGF